ncbi:hypothetical protein V6N12_062507 [Hibiscus sabdariffa]|uniref:Uncharacterized protein n=1 Tax=Hibiscus sabdariffa TaxID=183260 RepID=A0ABR2F924_9ROSI
MQDTACNVNSSGCVGGRVSFAAVEDLCKTGDRRQESSVSFTVHNIAFITHSLKELAGFLKLLAITKHN